MYHYICGCDVAQFVINSLFHVNSPPMCVVVVEIITLYQVQTGRFLATTGYVAPSPYHVQNNVQKRSECILPCVCLRVRSVNRK